MNDHMLTGMREAMSLLQKDGPIAATAKIQQTLQGLMPTGAWVGSPEASDTADHTDRAPIARTEPAAMLGNLLPDLLAKLKIPADEFLAELERMKAATAKSDNRELTDEEASGVVAAGTPGICIHDIDQLIVSFPYYSS